MATTSSPRTSAGELLLVPAVGRIYGRCKPGDARWATEPILLGITQGTEPHIYRVRIRLAVASALGDTNACALVSSNLSATTYYTGGQPPS